DVGEPAVRHARVLVVDDEPTIADGLRMVLSADGYAVRVAGTLASALGEQADHDFDLAVVDMVLPDGDGLSLLKELKSRDPSLEIIVVTAHSSVPKAVEAIKAGAFYFVGKPFDRDGPWVKINCAALPKDLIESELFGHVKGAFTGATTDKAGLLEEANRGSLLLDEITEMPIDLQAKLLRVLEDRTFRRIGGAKSI